MIHGVALFTGKKTNKTDRINCQFRRTQNKPGPTGYVSEAVDIMNGRAQRILLKAILRTENKRAL